MSVYKFLLLSIVLGVGAFAADEPNVVGKVHAFGVFAMPAGEEILDTPGTPSGKTRTTQGPFQLLSSTNVIPAELNTRFGFLYSVTNLPAGKDQVTITKVVRHPPMRKPDGSVATGFTFNEIVPVKNRGAVAATGYGFDHQYELIPGIWDFEMKFNGTSLFTQRFEVYLPSAARPTSDSKQKASPHQN